MHDYITARAFAPIEKILDLFNKAEWSFIKHTKFILLKGKILFI